MPLTTKIIRIGSGSKGVIIPSDVCRMLDISEHDELLVTVMGDQIILKKDMSGR